jgi:hypothetical protein
MSTTNNVTPIRPESEKKPRPPRRKRQPPVNTFEMPDNLRLVLALQGVCAAQERLMNYEVPMDLEALEVQDGLATAAAILSQMVRESLTNTGVI